MITDSSSNIVQTIIALYTSDMANLGNFYAEALNLKLKEKGDDYICLGRGKIEINIIKMNGKPENEVVKDERFSIREEAPIKCSFLIDSFDQVRKAINEYGGGAGILMASTRKGMSFSSDLESRSKSLPNKWIIRHALRMLD